MSQGQVVTTLVIGTVTVIIVELEAEYDVELSSVTDKMLMLPVGVVIDSTVVCDACDVCDA